jgi:hypothetical protein
MKFKSKVTFLVSGEIHDENFSIEDVTKMIEIKVKPWIDTNNKELWPYNGEPSPLVRKYTIESIKRVDS